MNARTILGSRLSALGLGVVVVLSSAWRCSPREEPSPVTPGGVSSESDSARVVRLEREALALAKVDGCTSADQCRSAPVGERPCGGPRSYVVYCQRTTDSAGLYRKLAELRQAETELNRKNNAMSTCEFRTPPELTATAGSCKAR